MLGTSLKQELSGHDVVEHNRFISDLSCPFQADRFYTFVNKVHPDYVIHTAALVGGLNYNKVNPYEFTIKNNTINNVVLDAAVRAKVPRFLGIASVCCYGDGFAQEYYPLTENRLFEREPHPTNAPYAYSKRGLVQSILAVNSQYNARYNYLIPTNLYGENDSRGQKAHFCSMMIDRIITYVRSNEKEIVFMGNGEAKRQYIHVDDLSQIIKCHVELDIDANYNVAGDEEFSARQMAQTLLDEIGYGGHLKFSDTMTGGQLCRTVSTDLFRSYFPHFKFMPFNIGVKRVYDKWA